jgi:hypothetical protein
MAAADVNTFGFSGAITPENPNISPVRRMLAAVAANGISGHEYPDEMPVELPGRRGG